MLDKPRKEKTNCSISHMSIPPTPALSSFSRRTHLESAVSVAADVTQRTLLNAAIRASRARGDLLPHNVAVVAEAKLICAVADNRAFSAACGGAPCGAVGWGG